MVLGVPLLLWTIPALDTRDIFAPRCEACHVWEGPGECGTLGGEGEGRDVRAGCAGGRRAEVGLERVRPKAMGLAEGLGLKAALEVLL